MLTDIYKTEISEGDFISFPVRRGSTMKMRTAKVLKVRQRYSYVKGDHQVLDVLVAVETRDGKLRTKKVVVSNLGNVIVLPKAYVQYGCNILL